MMKTPEEATTFEVNNNKLRITLQTVTIVQDQVIALLSCIQDGNEIVEIWLEKLGYDRYRLLIDSKLTKVGPDDSSRSRNKEYAFIESSGASEVCCGIAIHLLDLVLNEGEAWAYVSGSGSAKLISDGPVAFAPKHPLQLHGCSTLLTSRKGSCKWIHIERKSLFSNQLKLSTGAKIATVVGPC